ncbi:MAG: hypothetical protein BZ136_08315, partial [Methanosphaera sp. rholeuAM74]
MKIPQQIRDTDEFKKLRILKHKAQDSKNIVMGKLHAKIEQMRKPKRKLSKQEMEELEHAIRSSVDKDSIPV